MAEFIPLRDESGKEVPDPAFQSVQAIMKALFPDMLESFSGTITSTRDLRYGVTGNYTEKENAIKVAKRYPTDVSIIDLLDTVLHEIQHAQTSTKQAQANSMAGDLGYKGNNGTIGQYDYKIEEEKNAIVEKADTLGLPSVNKKAWKNNLGEILATAVPTLMMKERGIAGAPYEKEIAELMKDPDIANFVNRNRRPDLPSIRANPVPISEYITNAFKSLLSGK